MRFALCPHTPEGIPERDAVGVERNGLLAGWNLHDELRPSQRAFAASTTPAVTWPTDHNRSPFKRQAAIQHLAANQKLGAERFNHFPGCLLEPHTSPQRIGGPVGEFVPPTYFSHMRGHRSPYVEAHVGNRTTDQVLYSCADDLPSQLGKLGVTSLEADEKFLATAERCAEFTRDVATVVQEAVLASKHRREKHRILVLKPGSGFGAKCHGCAVRSRRYTPWDSLREEKTP